MKDTNGEAGRLGAALSSPATNAEEFKQSLDRRRRDADSLEKDLLNEVPMLYGSPGSLRNNGDPGIALARLHREEMLRRNGYDVADASGHKSEVLLPFERTTGALAFILFFIVLLGNFG